ncbi:MAG: 7-cyano-7-deazaguanine synthase QueC [Planctomycetota bacterium]
MARGAAGSAAGRCAIALVSGGMDSAVSAAIALAQNAELAFLHVSYGQRTWRKELACFRALARHYGVGLGFEVKLPHLAAAGGSCLTDRGIAVPTDALGALGVPVSYVPFRNANLLACATSIAEGIGARTIYIGAVEADSSGYPDCRRAFFRSFERVIREGTRPGSRIAIRTPVIGMSKGEIVRQGTRLGVPFDLTWSCYQGTKVACGRCDSCLLRLRGFREAGVRDPIPYRKRLPRSPRGS